MNELNINICLNKMLEGNFHDPDGEEEAIVIQALRSEERPEQIDRICQALSKSGSWYSLATLIAKVQMASSDRLKTIYAKAIWQIREREFQPEDPRHEMLNDAFWRTKWIGGLGRFASFITLFVEADRIDDPIAIDIIATKFASEMQLDLSPYGNFQQLKLCLTEWDLERDAYAIFDGVNQGMLLEKLFEELDLSKEHNELFKEEVANMKTDYLVTKMGLHTNFNHYHTLIHELMCLNISNT